MEREKGRESHVVFVFHIYSSCCACFSIVHVRLLYIVVFHVPDGIDLVLVSVSIGDGCCTEDLVAGDTTTYHFTYAIVKGQVSDPTQIKYKAFISLDRDLDSSTTHMITQGEHSWNTASGTTASCKFCMCYFSCVIMC